MCMCVCGVCIYVHIHICIHMSSARILTGIYEFQLQYVLMCGSRLSDRTYPQSQSTSLSLSTSQSLS